MIHEMIICTTKTGGEGHCTYKIKRSVEEKTCVSNLGYRHDFAVKRTSSCKQWRVRPIVWMCFCSFNKKYQWCKSSANKLTFRFIVNPENFDSPPESPRMGIVAPGSMIVKISTLCMTVWVYNISIYGPSWTLSRKANLKLCFIVV